MRWFEFIRNANESEDFEKYIDAHWAEFPESEKIWDRISCEPLEESFIRRHDQLVNWDIVCRHSVLSEAFMEEYKNCINWSSVSSCQHFGSDFANRHRYELVWGSVLPRFQFTEMLLLDLIYDPNVEIDIGCILNTQSLRRTTVSKLISQYREEEIQRNLTHRQPMLHLDSEETPKTTEKKSLFGIFKHRRK